MIAIFVTWLAQLSEWQTVGSCTIQRDEYDINEGASGEDDSGQDTVSMMSMRVPVARAIASRMQRV